MVFYSIEAEQRAAAEKPPAAAGMTNRRGLADG